MLRRILVLFLVSTAVLVGGAGVQNASAHHKRGVCDFHWSRDDGYSAWGVKRIIRCAARQFSVPGGAPRALSVARCESRYNPYATNGPYKGVFQQASPYWRDRYRRFGLEYLANAIYNARTNVLVSVRMAHRLGWSHWGCA